MGKTKSEKQIDQLSKNQLIQVLKNEINFRFEVPDILTFISDDYYLGKWFRWNGEKGVYPFWQDKLQELFPTPVTTKSSYIVTTGAIGTGKSTFSTIVLLYDYMKLLAMATPERFFRLLNLNGIWLFGCSFYKYKALDFINPIQKILKDAPFIKDLKKKNEFNDNVKIAAAYGKNSIVSTDAAVIWLSEVNEYKDPDDMISSSLSRMQGRFQKGMGLFNHFILDCSDTTVDSATERFIHKSAYSDKVFVVHPSIWDVKPWFYWHKNPKSFKVYGGDSVSSPHIIEEGEDTSKFDQDRILEVPSELYNEFSMDICKALQEKAGISLISGGLFFPDDYIKRFFKIPMLTKSVDLVDFFDNSTIMDSVEGMREAVDNLLPNDKYIFVGLDAGYVSDQFGIAIGYVESASFVNVADNINKRELKDYYLKFPIVIGLDRKPGQQTSLTKVRNFLYELHQSHPIHTLAYDSHQTENIAQDLRRIGIQTSLISVEQDKHYIEFKHSICEGKISLPKNKLLYREFRCLKHFDGYIDHSPVEGTTNGEQEEGVDAKDLTDALVRCFVAIQRNIEDSMEVPEQDGSFKGDFMLNFYDSYSLYRTEQDNIRKFQQRCAGRKF